MTPSISDSPSKVKISILSNSGSGDRRNLEMEKGTTLQEVADYLQVKTKDHIVTVNNQASRWDTEVREGDVVSISALKTPGA